MFKKGIYEFTTLTGKKVHTLEIVKIQKNKETNERRCFAKLNGGKEKVYQININKNGIEYITVPQWKTNILPTDYKEEDIKIIQKSVGELLGMKYWS